MKGEKPGEPPEEVLSRFPQAKEAIRHAFGEDEVFRELCDDYLECLAVIARLRRAQGMDDDRIEQYCEFSVHLEHELLNRISRCQACPPGVLEQAPGGDHDLSTAPPTPLRDHH